jgi:cytochrome P450
MTGDLSRSAAKAGLRELPKLRLSAFLSRVLDSEKERVDMLGGLRETYERHGNAAAISLPFIKFVYLFGPDANRRVLLDPERIFSARKPWMEIMGRIFPNGLLLLDGERHKADRKIMHSAFTRPALRHYAMQMNPIVESEIGSWTEDGRTIQAFPRIKALTLNMAAQIFVGMQLGPEAQSLSDSLEDMVAASMSLIRLPIPGTEFQRGLKARRFMLDFIGSKIAGKRAGQGQDMFSRFCNTVTEDGERFEDQQIIDHMSFLMMAAHDTTTSTLTSMLYELAKNPDWQERIREQALAFGEGPVGFDDLGRFDALRLAMRETLRLYPPLPVIPRVVEQEFEFEGFRVPKGAMVVISPLFSHRMPEWWDEPEQFDPDRFGPERAEHERHSHNYIPFGGGPHMCLGLRFAETQITLVLHHLVRRYRWSVRDDYTMPVQQAPISKPRDGLPLTLERIDSSA